MSDDVPPIPPPFGDPRRSAWDKLRGYHYQLWHAILRWINSSPDQDIYIETAEDVDLVSPDRVESEQLKHVAAKLSLNTEAAMKALRDFWKLKTLNVGRRVIFNYITTGGVAKEENGQFTKERPGLDVWESAKSQDADVEEIRSYLLKKAPQLETENCSLLPDDLLLLLREGPVGRIREELIEPVTWQTNAPDINNIVEQVEDAIFAYSFQNKDPFPEHAIGDLKSDLLYEAMGVATSRLDRRLTARKFANLFKSKTLVTVPRALLPNLASLQDPPAPEPPFIPIDWRVPSSDLEEWPTWVGNNREIERAELETIKKTIDENSFSAQFILGEAGSGKSALLAKLAKILVHENTTCLALKADFIGAEVESLESLVPGLIGLNLAKAIKDEARTHRFVVIVDQLDAVCSVTDRKPRRLTLILQLLRELAEKPNVHIVASCRPFEFDQDLRLKTLHATKISLNLPPWEKVADLLQQEGVNPADFTDEHRQVLRVPWNLKLFLSLPAPRPVVKSFYDLAGKIWENAVKQADHSQRCLELVDLIARKIDKLEDFWILKTNTDGYVPERSRLLSENILLQPPDPSLIGFRHQTFYDYFLMGIFEREKTSLDLYVTDHNASFFIRPTVARALIFLRATNLQTYHKALADLMAAGRLRRHLKYLVLEFVGKQQAPSHEEIELFLPMLKDEKLGRQFLQAISGSKGWFVALLNSTFVSEWMTSKERAGIAGLFLGSVITMAEDEVVSLMSVKWFGDPVFDSTGLWVLAQAKIWNPGALHLMEEYAKRARIDDAAWALNQLIRKFPAKAAPIVGHLFRRRADEVRFQIEAEIAVASSSGAAADLPDMPETDIEARINGMLADDPVAKKVKELIAKDLFHHAGLDQVAQQDPLRLLRETWPTTKQMLELTQNRKPEPGIVYERDDVGVDHSPYTDRGESMVLAIEGALQQLARTEPEQFQAWAEVEQTGSSLAVHRLLATGALQLPVTSADWVMSYLNGDPRRLYLGDFRDEFEDTRALISKFGPHASSLLLGELTSRIVDLPTTLLPVASRVYPETPEDRRIASLRRDRAQLLTAFPQSKMPESGQTALAADVEEYGQPRRGGTRSQGGFVGAPVRAEEFAGMSVDEVFAVLNKYPDNQNRSDLWTFHEDISRSGGVLQQSEAVAAFTLTNLDMGRSILKRLEPGRHEKYATAIVNRWAVPEANNRNQTPAMPPGEIEVLVLELADSGFASVDFRIGMAQVLQVVARNNKGLKPETLAMLKTWLPEMPLPEPKDYDPSEGKDIKDSILYSGHGGWLCPTGRAPIVEAIIMGELYQNPAKIEEAVSFLEGLSETEHHPAVWAEALMHVSWLFGQIPERMTALVDKLVGALPGLLSYPQTAHFLSEVTGAVTPPALEETWIAKLLKPLDPMSHLLAGELTILNFARKKSQWAKTMIHSELTAQVDEEFLRGIAYGAAAFIGTTALAEDLEPILATTLVSPSEKVRDAALTFLPHIDEKTWTPSAKRLLNQVLENDLRQKRTPETIGRQLESIALVDPGYALSVAEQFVKMMAEDTSRPNDWKWGASHLTSIALAAQRVEATQDRGLTLFEDLLDMSVHDAKRAAELMNHREAADT